MVGGHRNRPGAWAVAALGTIPDISGGIRPNLHAGTVRDKAAHEIYKRYKLFRLLIVLQLPDELTPHRGRRSRTLDRCV